MSEITSSLTQVLKNIQAALKVDVDLFNFPDLDVSCALSLTEIKKAKRTGEYFKVVASLAIECRVSDAVDNKDLVVLEVAADVLSQIENSTFLCSGLIPTNEIALPYGYYDSFSAWIVTWDQEFWVEKLTYEP